MGGIMKGGAVVEPDAVKKMKKDTDELAANLKETSKNLINRTNELNSRGFQDSNFEQLHTVIMANKDNLEKLEKVMESFSEYLQKVEKNIRELMDGPKLKGGNIKID